MQSLDKVATFTSQDSLLVMARTSHSHHQQLPSYHRNFECIP